MQTCHCLLRAMCCMAISLIEYVGQFVLRDGMYNPADPDIFAVGVPLLSLASMVPYKSLLHLARHHHVHLPKTSRTAPVVLRVLSAHVCGPGT